MHQMIRNPDGVEAQSLSFDRGAYGSRWIERSGSRSPKKRCTGVGKYRDAEPELHVPILPSAAADSVPRPARTRSPSSRMCARTIDSAVSGLRD